MTYAFAISGEPVPKGRPRKGRNGAVYTPARTRQAERAFAWSCRTAATAGPLEGPLRVELEFVLGSRRRVDLDNLAKLACDAANGVLWADDSQIVELVARKRVEPGRASTTVRVRTVDALGIVEAWEARFAPPEVMT